MFKNFFNLSILAIFTLTIFSCQSKQRKAQPLPDNIDAYISGYTSGIISKGDAVRLQFTNFMVEQDQIGKEAPRSIISLEPATKGKAVWEDRQTIVFRPDDLFTSGTQYLATVDINPLIKNIKKEEAVFEFNFSTRSQHIQVSFEGLNSPDPQNLTQQQLRGKVHTVDIATTDEIEKTLSISQNNTNLSIEWIHENDNQNSIFIVDGITRGDKASTVKAVWNGSPIGVQVEEEKSFDIPALNDFKLIDAQIIDGDNGYVQLNFSDPILASQNLEGLLSISDYVGKLQTAVEGNFVKVFLAGKIAGEHTINVGGGIQNIANKKMGTPSTWTLTFENIQPEVRLTGEGVVLPDAEGLYYPFEAKGLHSVRVEIAKIFNDNILQFLQDNEIDSKNRHRLHKVGRIIYQEKISLNTLAQDKQNGEWKQYALDLNKLFEKDKNAIYQVRIGFYPEDANLPCQANKTTKEESSLTSFDATENYDSFMKFWYGPNGYYDGYQWEDRKNPCKAAYYNSDRFVVRNVLSSNFGIIVQQDSDEKYTATITDLRTAMPIQGVKLSYYDYQQQVISETLTDASGIGEIKLVRSPFALVVEKDKQKGYLKLKGAPSLRMSKFDTGGAYPQKGGMKGFLYTERGVWRPGDSIYLNLILEDQDASLPPNYPVSLTVRDARGKDVFTYTSATNTNGIYPLPFATSTNAPTGNWRATVKAGGAIFSKNLKVETVKPNRLKIDLDFGSDELSILNEPQVATLQSNWLHGAPAANLKAVVEAKMVAINTDFDQYGNYEFDDPARRINDSSRKIFDGELNETGNVQIEKQLLQTNQAPGKLKVNFKTRVFEKGGDFSFDNFSLPYSPFTSYAGIQIPTDNTGNKRFTIDKENSIKFVVVDEAGKPLANHQIKIGLYRVNWRWWWDSSYDYHVTKYNSSRHYDAQDTEVVTTNAKGEAMWTTKVTNWGRYMVRACDTESGHCSGDFFFAGSPWNDTDQIDKEAASVLALTTDKAKYNVGDKVKLKIPGGKEGRALIGLMSGSKILEQIWLETKEGNNEFVFEVTKDMAPNIYAHVMLLQPHAQVNNDLPIRLYGATPIMVEDKNTILEPIIDMPDEIRPKTDFTVKVSETNGKEMSYTIAIVDEGLLSLTRFPTPKPWEHFYKKEALGISTWDIYNKVLGAHTDKLDQVIAIGGDMAIKNPDDSKNANRFKPVVMHIGPFHLQAGKKATHQLTMPNYVGQVRTMVVAANTQDAAYGHADKDVPVRNPLMVLSSMPRVLGPGEEVVLPINVFAMKDNIKNVTVTAKESSGLVDFIGSNSTQLTFSGTGDKMANLRFKVKENIGVAKFYIEVKGHGEKATEEIEIQVRNPNPFISKVTDKVIANKESWSTNYQAIGMKGTNSGVLEVSAIPPINLERHLKYLIGYPYGCIEQTLSKGFPQLYLADLVELTEEQKTSIPGQIDATIDRLNQFQNSDGAFTYWPGGSHINHWANSYAGHFLIEAKNKGYAVPSHLLDNWADAQQKMAKLWSPDAERYGYYNWESSSLSQAYRLYTLALYGKPALGAMNQLRNSNNMGLQARWVLAAAYAVSGKTSQAQKLTNDLSRDIDDYTELSYNFGSSLRDRSMIVNTLLHLGDKETATLDIRYIAEQLSKDRWYSTQTLAFSLMAVANYAGKVDIPEKLQFAYSLGNQQKTNIGSDKPIMQIPLTFNTANTAVKVENPNQSPLFARLILNGQPVAGLETASAKNIDIEVAYYNMQHQQIDPSNITQGTDFYALVRVKHQRKRSGNFDEMALDQIFPSGWEIINTRMDNFSPLTKDSYADYRDYRDDRVYTFFDLDTQKTLTYKVLLNAAWAGKYYLPAVSCQAMYDNTISANTIGQWVEVTK